MHVGAKTYCMKPVEPYTLTMTYALASSVLGFKLLGHSSAQRSHVEPTVRQMFSNKPTRDYACQILNPDENIQEN